MELIETSVGLPNNCTVCGKPMTGSWFVWNVDQARAGLGGHKKCLELPVPEVESEGLPEPEPEPVTYPTRKSRLKASVEEAAEEAAEES